MGYMTTITILNDGFDQLQKNPQDFVDGINRHMHQGGTFGVGNHANNVEVAPTRHADEFRLYAVQANSMVELSPWNTETEKLSKTYPGYVRSQIEQARYFLDKLEATLETIHERQTNG